MLNFYKKLSLVVLSGALTLGLSSVANAGMIVNWVFAMKKLDCQRTCGATGLTYPIFADVERIKGSNKLKPISICATNINSRNRKNKWLTGYNIGTFDVEAESSCIISVDGKEYHGKEYYCISTNRGLQPLR
jgi:hypothetical protein